jgi:hypothetical protein
MLIMLHSIINMLVNVTLLIKSYQSKCHLVVITCTLMGVAIEFITKTSEKEKAQGLRTQTIDIIAQVVHVVGFLFPLKAAASSIDINYSLACILYIIHSLMLFCYTRVDFYFYFS